jgi:hypothetical protein
METLKEHGFITVWLNPLSLELQEWEKGNLRRKLYTWDPKTGLGVHSPSLESHGIEGNPTAVTESQDTENLWPLLQMVLNTQQDPRAEVAVLSGGPVFLAQSLAQIQSAVKLLFHQQYFLQFLPIYTFLSSCPSTISTAYPHFLTLFLGLPWFY